MVLGEAIIRTMANFLYVDNSNVWIEGMHVSAVAKGMAPDIRTAQQEKVRDYSWKIDFGRLHDFAGGTTDVGRAVLYGSRPPANDSLWAVAKANGFEVIVHDRNVRNREKKIDTSIATDIVSESFELMKPGDEVTLVSGDADFVPAIENLRRRQFTVIVVFWEHAAIDLQNAATRFVSLNPHLDHLCFH
jgi:uncharacterized LabA/DUF88 family protein